MAVVAIATTALRQLPAIAAILLVFIVIDRCRQYWRLRHFNGPRTTGVSWWWHSMAVLSGDSHLWYSEANEKHGPIARVAPNHLITSSPELWAHINSARSTYTRAPWYYHAARFEPGKDNLFTECDNKKHDVKKRMMASAYTGKENPGLELSIDVLVEKLVNLIRSKYCSPAKSAQISKPMDLASKLHYLTLDVVSTVGLGEEFGALNADRDINDYIKATSDGLRFGNVLFGLGLAWILDVPILGALIRPSEKDLSGYGRMMAEARKAVEARKSQPLEGKSDMMASFLRHGVSNDDLFQEVFDQIVAGSDTTAASITAILLYIMSNPRVYQKLQAEIDGAVKDGIAPASPGVISDASARQLPYLSAVIREGQRLHSPVVNIFSRVAPKEGDQVVVDGKEYFIPGGTMIGYSAWSMHRENKALYGDDAEAFRPERWLVGEQEQLTHMCKVNDMVLGYGRWSCLGKVVAMIELRKSIFELLRNFDLALVNPDKPWEIYNALGLLQIDNMRVNVTERS